MFDPKQARLITQCDVPGILFAVCQDRPRHRLFVAGMDRAVYEVNTAAKQLAAKKRWTHHDSYVSSLAMVDGAVVSAGFDRRLVWTDYNSGKRIRSVDDAHDGWIRDIATFAEGRRIVSVGDDMLVKTWDAQTARQIGSWQGHAKQTPQGYATAIYTVAVSPDGKTIASGDRIGQVLLWDAASGRQLCRLEAPEFYTYDSVKRSRSLGGIRSLCFSADGSKLAISGIGAVTNVDGFVGPSRVEVWNWRAGKRVFVGQDKHKAVLNHILFHPDDPTWLIAAGGGDSGGILAFWDQKNSPAAHKAKPKGHLQRFCFDQSKQRLFAVGHGGLQVWGFDVA